MKVKCPGCRSHMEFPFHECDKCGWRARGRFRKAAHRFALKYINQHGNDPELKSVLELARRGIDRNPGSWKTGTKMNGEPEVPCPACGNEMMFPYIQCGGCGWVARKEMRKKARVLAGEYMDNNPDSKGSLEIIWDEENRRLRKKSKNKRERKNHHGMDGGSRALRLSLPVGIMVLMSVLLGAYVSLEQGGGLATALITTMIFLLLSAFVFIIPLLSHRKKK